MNILRHRYGRTRWYTWVVDCRAPDGRLRRAIIETTTQEAAIAAIRKTHPHCREFSAVKASRRPL